MTQFGTELLASVQQSFAGYLMRDRELKNIANRVRDGTSYEDANLYAVRLGELLSQSILDNTQTLPYMSQEVAREVLEPMLTAGHELAIQAASTIQQNMNTAAGVGLAVQTADLDTNRINGLIDKVASYDTYDEARYLMGEPIVNYEQAVVDQTIRKNAAAHSKAGFEPEIIRKTAPREVSRGLKRVRSRKGKVYTYPYSKYPQWYTFPCNWCEQREGVYKYKDVSNTGNDVFRRHENCRCVIIYRDANKTINVRTQKEWTGDDVDAIKRSIGKQLVELAPAPKPNNPLFNGMGEPAYNRMQEIVDRMPERSRAVWQKFVDRIQIGTLNLPLTKGAYAQGNEIFLNLLDVVNPNNGYDKPFQTFFHECHHVIDKIAGRDAGRPFHYSAIFKDGLFPKTIRDEVQALVKARADIIKPLVKAGDLDALVNMGAITATDKRWIEHGWQELKYTKDMAYRVLQTEVRGMERVARCDLSDILEGATNGKISCGFGHGKTYWRDRTYGDIYDGLATEAFAEMSDSLFTNPDALAAIQQYLPQSFAVYEDMIESLAGV